MRDDALCLTACCMMRGRMTRYALTKKAFDTSVRSAGVEQWVYAVGT